MRGTGTKQDTTIAERSVLLDLTRLVRRAGQRQTGVDQNILSKILFQTNGKVNFPKFRYWYSNQVAIVTLKIRDRFYDEIPC